MKKFRLLFAIGDRPNKPAGLVHIFGAEVAGLQQNNFPPERLTAMLQGKINIVVALCDGDRG